MRVILFASTAAFFSVSSAWADADFDKNIKILAAVRETVITLCPTVKPQGGAQAGEVNASLNATLPALWKVVNVGGSVGGKVSKSNYHNVLQADLAKIIIDNHHCRVEAMDTILSKLFGRSPELTSNARVSSKQSLNLSTSATRDSVKSLTGNVSGPPATPASSGVTLRVFLKNNMTSRDVIALAKLLPNYDVRIGKSDIDPRLEADTLFVNPNRVSKNEVLAVARALARLGVNIKTIQQSSVGNRREIQLGTYATSPTGGAQYFADLSALDLARLGHMAPTDFWVEAANGRPMCSDGIGLGHRCSPAEIAVKPYHETGSDETVAQ